MAYTNHCCDDGHGGNTGTQYAAYVFLLIVSLSIFIAFILEAFFVEYSLEKSEVETAIEKKIHELGVGVQE